MTDQIKVSEVSAILRQQLEGISTGIRTEEVGTVLQVSDGVARIYGLDNAEANELLQFDNGMEAIVMNLEEDNVGAVLLGPTDQVKEGDIVKRTGRIASINVSEGMIGRVTRSETLSTEKGKSREKPVRCHSNARRRGLSSASPSMNRYRPVSRLSMQ